MGWVDESKDTLVATLKPSEKIGYPKNAKKWKAKSWHGYIWIAGQGKTGRNKYSFFYSPLSLIFTSKSTNKANNDPSSLVKRNALSVLGVYEQLPDIFSKISN